MSRTEQINALAIKHNPSIQVSVNFDADNGKFVGSIIGGLDDRYKLLFVSGSIYDSSEEARVAMQERIEEIRAAYNG